MPQIDEILKEREKKFNKKNYRPWDLGGNSNANNQEEFKNGNDVAVISSKDKENKLKTESKNIELNKVQKSSIEFKENVNRVQKGSNISPIEFNKGSNRAQLNSNPEGNLYAQLKQNEVKILIKKLNGNERKVFFLVIHACCANNSLTTGEISSKNFDHLLEMPRNSRETAIKRLVKKYLILRERGKNGLNGTLTLSVTETVKSEALTYLSSKPYDQALHLNSLSNVISNLKTNRVQKGFNIYSSSYIYNKTTTTEESSEILPQEWRELDLSELQKRGIRFGQEHLLQIYPIIKKYSVLDFQESLDGFVYDLDNGKTPRFRIGPLNFLLGIYKAGNLYVSESYISPENKLILEMAERAEKKQKELEEANFNIWLDTQDLTTLEHKLPPDMRVDFKVNGHRWKEWIRQNIYLKEKLANH